MKGIKIIAAIILVIIIGALLFVRTYTSSPGFVTQEMAEEFSKTAKKCAGFSILLNAEEVATDASGKSLCIGILK